MTTGIVNVIADKLAHEAKESDTDIALRFGEICKFINPTPACIPVDTLVKQLYEACVVVVSHRADSISRNISEVFNESGLKITPSLKDALISVCEAHLPDGLYINQIDKVPGVYARRAAPDDFDDRKFQLELAKWRVGMESIVKSQRNRVRQEIHILAEKLKPIPWWERAYENHGKEIVNALIVAGLLGLAAFLFGRNESKPTDPATLLPEPRYNAAQETGKDPAPLRVEDVPSAPITDKK